MEQHQAFAIRVGAAAVFLMALLAGSTSALAGSETPRAGNLVVSKECSGFVNDPPYCAITSSSLDAIPVGSKIIYLDPAGLRTAAGGAVVLDPPDLETTRRSAHGFLGGNLMHCESGGTGRFTWFRQRRGHGYRRGTADRAVALARDVQLQSTLKRANTPLRRTNSRGGPTPAGAPAEPNLRCCSCEIPEHRGKRASTWLAAGGPRGRPLRRCFRRVNDERCVATRRGNAGEDPARRCRGRRLRQRRGGTCRR